MPVRSDHWPSLTVRRPGRARGPGPRAGRDVLSSLTDGPAFAELQFGSLPELGPRPRPHGPISHSDE
eukprot:605238-Hanusia_phi.AAC.2